MSALNWLFTHLYYIIGLNKVLLYIIYKIMFVFFICLFLNLTGEKDGCRVNLPYHILFGQKNEK